MDRRAQNLSNRGNLNTENSQPYKSKKANDYSNRNQAEPGNKYYREISNLTLDQSQDYYDKNFKNVKSDIERYMDNAGKGMKMNIEDRRYRNYVMDDLEKSMIGYNPRTYTNYDEFAAYRQFVMRYDGLLSNDKDQPQLG